jgi:excisionase family DNA binding protein
MTLDERVNQLLVNVPVEDQLRGRLVEEAGKILGVSAVTVYRYVAEGALSHVKVEGGRRRGRGQAGAVRVRLLDCIRFMVEREVPAGMKKATTTRGAAPLRRRAVRRMSELGRYVVLRTRRGDDPRVRGLSLRASGLLMRLMMSRSCTSFGAVVGGRAALAEETGVEAREFSEAFAELERAGLVLAEWPARLVFLTFMPEDDRPSNESAAIGRGRMLGDPESLFELPQNPHPAEKP